MSRRVFPPPKRQASLQELNSFLKNTYTCYDTRFSKTQTTTKMFHRRTSLLLADSYKDFTSSILRKLKVASTAVELRGAIQEVLEAEDERLRGTTAASSSTNQQNTKQFEAMRQKALGATVNSMLMECQNHMLWRQAYVVLSTAATFGVALRPLWPAMVMSAAPNESARSEMYTKVVSSGLAQAAGSGRAMSKYNRFSTTAQGHSSSLPGGDDDVGGAMWDSASGGSALMPMTTTSSSPVGGAATRGQESAAAAAAAAAAIQRHPTNLLFDQYYLKQRIVRNDMEMALLTDALRRRPKLCFRINLSYPGWRAVHSAVTGSRGSGGGGLSFVDPIPWAENAFVLNPPDDVLLEGETGGGGGGSKNKSNKGSEWTDVELRTTREWINRCSEEGVISIQSPSSLLVGALMQPRGDDAVLDMCAAPGSKTRQMMDCMMRSASSSFLLAPRGVVVANEYDTSRHRALANLLCPGAADQHHHYQRARAVSDGQPFVAVSRHDGATFPVVSRLGPWSKILVDAPCTGDGMLNKMPRQWATWSPSRGLAHHNEQVKLLQRAVDIAAAGARIVYSTCTLNPIENEAVVAAVLRNGQCELEPCGASVFGSGGAAVGLDDLSTFFFSSSPKRAGNNRSSNGLKDWMVPIADKRLGAEPFRYVPSSQQRSSSSSSSLRKQQHHQKNVQRYDDDMDLLISRLPPTLFNNDEGIGQDLAQCCWRLHPHIHKGFDAFFVAVLRKRHYDANNINPLSSSSSSPFFGKTNQVVATRAKNLRRASVEGDAVSSSLMTHFGISSSTMTTAGNSNINKSNFTNGAQFVVVDASLDSLNHASGDAKYDKNNNNSSSSRSQQPAVLRVLSEKAWNLATDESNPIQHVLCTGAAVAVQRALDEPRTSVRSISSAKNPSSSWNLTVAGATMLGPAATRNIVVIPAAAFRMLLTTGITKRSSLSVDEMCIDDRAALRNAYRRTVDDTSSSSISATEMMMSGATLPPQWAVDLCKYGSSATTSDNTSPSQIIVACATPRVYLPVVAVTLSSPTTTRRSADDEYEEMDTVTTTMLKNTYIQFQRTTTTTTATGGGGVSVVEPSELRRLERLLSQTADRPVKLDHPDGASKDGASGGGGVPSKPRRRADPSEAPVKETRLSDVYEV